MAFEDQFSETPEGVQEKRMEGDTEVNTFSNVSQCLVCGRKYSAVVATYQIILTKIDIDAVKIGHLVLSL